MISQCSITNSNRTAYRRARQASHGAQVGNGVLWQFVAAGRALHHVIGVIGVQTGAIHKSSSVQLHLVGIQIVKWSAPSVVASSNGLVVGWLDAAKPEQCHNSVTNLCVHMFGGLRVLSHV